MTRALVALALVVVIRVVTLSPCPPKPWQDNVVKQPNGTYQRGGVISVTTEWCEVRNEHDEEWTDYPEKGGTFIRRVTKP